MNKTVVIIQENLPHYRVPFYKCLRSILQENQIECILVYDPGVISNLIPGRLEWAVPIPIKWLGPFGWQSIMGLARGADLVVVQQEVKYLSNFFLLVRRHLRGLPSAFWGHGKNMQARNPNSCAENVKRLLSKHVDWWFAYNKRSAAVVRQLGFPEERITLVQNAIDTRSVIEARNRLSPETIESTKTNLGVRSGNVAIYTGGLYGEKRLSFLLDAAAKVRAQLPDFHLIVIGGGPQKDLVIDASQNNSWIHYLGPMNDIEKIPYWAISKISLMPGLVGLGVLDSLALGVPLITTAYPYHSPEIEYLRDGFNGVVVTEWESNDAYANAVVEILKDDQRRLLMVNEGRKDAEFYTIENMASNFADGVIAALNAYTTKH
jgi:glycosyltransferase involved in cell wall biosynthesis